MYTNYRTVADIEADKLIRSVRRQMDAHGRGPQTIVLSDVDASVMDFVLVEFEYLRDMSYTYVPSSRTLTINYTRV